jgi:hypothetical protein
MWLLAAMHGERLGVWQGRQFAHACGHAPGPQPGLQHLRPLPPWLEWLRRAAERGAHGQALASSQLHGLPLPACSRPAATRPRARSAAGLTNKCTLPPAAHRLRPDHSTPWALPKAGLALPPRGARPPPSWRRWRQVLAHHWWVQGGSRGGAGGPQHTLLWAARNKRGCLQLRTETRTTAGRPGSRPCIDALLLPMHTCA